MNIMSVSTFSLREQLGRPMDFTFTDPSGKELHFTYPSTGEVGLSEFPARAKTTFGVGAIETVSFQFTGLDDPELDGSPTTSSPVTYGCSTSPSTSAIF
jgi:hypothetical protein